MKTAINAAIIKDRKILLVKKKEIWILPGGKPQEGESDIECLCREVREELSGTELENIRFYGRFFGKTPHSDEFLEAKVYLADVNGEIKPPSAEIRDSKYIENMFDYKLSDTTSKILRSLRRDNYFA